jgi:hypothetical protein
VNKSAGKWFPVILTPQIGDIGRQSITSIDKICKWHRAACSALVTVFISLIALLSRALGAAVGGVASDNAFDMLIAVANVRVMSA